MSAPKWMFIFYNSFSLWLTENIHEQKTFSQNMIYMFCSYDFSVKCIIKKNYLGLYGPLKNLYFQITFEAEIIHSEPLTDKRGLCLVNYLIEWLQNYTLSI